MPELRAASIAITAARVLRTACLLPLALGTVLEAAEPEIARYIALYEVELRGRVAGTSQFSVSRDDERGIYTFSSRARARGLLRLARPREAVEHSDFTVENGQIRPLEFRYEDGSRKGEDNVRMAFDWDAGVVSVDHGGASMQLELVPGALDRGSMQVALMRDIEANGRPGPYTLADEDGLAAYEFVRQDDTEVATPIGTFTAQRFLQRRDGSSRSTLVWVVPELRYLPVVIEQFRGDELRTRLLLQSVEGLGPGVQLR